MPNWKKVIVSGSDASLNSITASNGLYGTASWANNVTTLKAGSSLSSSFSGSPLSSSITFGSVFNNDNYAITVTGVDIRIWTISGKSSNGFTINSNSDVGLTGPVYWIATPFN